MLHPIGELLEVSLSSIKKMIEANTIIGTPVVYNNATIIPVSKVHLGFVSGGSDIKPNSNKEDPLFGGGTGGGVSISPIAFLVVYDDKVELLSIDNDAHLFEKLLEAISKLTDKAVTLFKNNAPIEKI
ncbi:MAG: GerW family sporulation protein [Anaeroplasma sp.]